jgi:RNA polymerase sigma-70 factor (ECF subfamily)
MKAEIRRGERRVVIARSLGQALCQSSRQSTDLHTLEFFVGTYPFGLRLRCSGMSANELPAAVQGSWTDFLHHYEPLRPELYRYCRHLTRSPWDAEDLVQDTLARAFVTLGQMGHAPPTPRAWLFRVASNLWIDRTRHRRVEASFPTDVRDTAAAADPRSTREIAGTLLGQLSPQERAAVVLKDVFDLSLDETAEALSTTVGAVKAALHRARGKLVEPPPEEPTTPRPEVLDAFCAAFNAGDLDRLTTLLLDTASVEVVGATTQYGRDAARRTVLTGMLFGHARLVAGDPSTGVDPRLTEGILADAPRVEARVHRGGWVLVHWYRHDDGEAVRALTRVEVDGDHVSHLQNYFFNVELIADVCAELGLPSRSNGYRWCVSRD